ncbi:hypothetical protein OV203_26020 [Nannocystis sp. ILAH1]|uniref:hypothetical protein n=1 Tax=Nannocystis sp. ILAH1 TaxID=2996789 RepID=UPI002271F3FD|nr:hypothetical protein [Nannocystis sp. ILAH1]MCY0990627.1 hypothetical protein [Nannocystis sp. ILAH1]
MAIRIKPPTHSIDQGGIHVASSDCWDNDRIEREKDILVSKKLAEVQEAAVQKYLAQHPQATEAELEEVRQSCKLTEEEKLEAAKAHPVARYFAGETRLQLDAPDWDHEGKPVTAREYLTGTPTEFYVRRLTWRQYRDTSAISQSHKRWEEFVRLGLRRIKSEGYTWELDRNTDRVPDDIMQSIHDADHSLITWLGLAVAQYNQPLTEVEGRSKAVGA